MYAVFSQGFLFIGSINQTFISGLAALKLFRQTGDSTWMHRGCALEDKMRLWSKNGSLWNFLHKALLLKAEINHCNGQHEDAESSYKAAIGFAKSHKFTHDEALCCELAAEFFLNTGNLSTALEHFLLAHEKYTAWGAVGKANMLFERINEKFAAGW
jgi:hypothetical protein